MFPIPLYEENPPIWATGSYPAEASCAGKSNFALLGQPRCISQCLQYVLALQIRIIPEQFLDGASCADLPNDHAYRHSHPANARLSAHDGRILGNAINLRHLWLHSLTPLLRREYHSSPHANRQNYRPTRAPGVSRRAADVAQSVRSDVRTSAGGPSFRDFGERVGN